MSMPVRTIGWLASVIALSCSGWGGAVAGSITGTATYRERMALPSDALFAASLEDVSHADAPADVIATTEVSSPRTPINFVLTFDDRAVSSDGRYIVRGRITVSGRVWFAGNSDVPPPTGRGAHHVALLLRRSGGDAGGVSLQTTSWKLRTLHGVAVTPVDPTREAWLRLDPADHRVAGFAGCNRLTGDYTLEGRDRVAFRHLAATLRICLHGMEQEQAFLKALRSVERWQVSGTRLALFDKDGTAVATFEAEATP